MSSRNVGEGYMSHFFLSSLRVTVSRELLSMIAAHFSNLDSHRKVIEAMEIELGFLFNLSVQATNFISLPESKAHFYQFCKIYIQGIYVEELSTIISHS